MNDIPKDITLDSSISLFREGYRFIANRMQKHGTDIFETRLLLKPAFCVTGEDAAAMFYHPDRFTRVGALPPTTVRLLQDVGSVQQIDDGDHAHRKAMFMGMMTPERIDDLLRTTAGEWQSHLANWSTHDSIVLFDEVEHLFCRAVCRWAGVPVGDKEANKRTEGFSSMVSAAGGVGPTTWKALLLRERSERWARSVIEQIRSGARSAPDESAARIIADYRDRNGEPLPVNIAAVELINILRPTVAVGRFIAFIAHALEHEPESRRFVTCSSDEETEWFVNEVRRFYPFFPFIGGIVREAFTWRGHHFGDSTWVILDIYGTNHDPRTWNHPYAFQPERFRCWNGSAFNFIPQGGGLSYDMTHRCAGEWITMALMKQAAIFLTTSMSYTIPAQDMSISLRTMPARPKSGIIMTNIQPAT